MCRSEPIARTTTSPEFRPTRMLDGDAVRAPDSLGVPLDRLLHAQRGVAGADGVILVGERRAEQRHDPVAHDLVDGALVAVDGLHHPFEHGVEELARLLGIAVGEQLHRALEVGEEHRDLLALALEGALRGEDPLGEVLGRVRLWGGEPRYRRWRRGSCRECCAAAIAEICSQPLSSRRSPGKPPRMSRRTPDRSGHVAIVRLAPRTLHAETFEHPDWRRSER